MKLFLLRCKFRLMRKARANHAFMTGGRKRQPLPPNKSTMTVRCYFHRNPAMPWLGGRRQWPSVWHSREVGLFATAWTDLLKDAASFSGIGTGFLNCCHGISFVNSEKPGHSKPQLSAWPDCSMLCELSLRRGGRCHREIGFLPRQYRVRTSVLPFLLSKIYQKTLYIAFNFSLNAICSVFS